MQSLQIYTIYKKLLLQVNWFYKFLFQVNSNSLSKKAEMPEIVSVNSKT